MKDIRLKELAINLAAGYVATVMMVGVDYAKKKYIKDDVNDYWYMVAGQVYKEVSDGRHKVNHNDEKI